ncbi:hypothetical protein, conserved [Trypanosoma brucei gambiense DAL972]|uniref:Uncharacterized protein n=1 Tax=Trypanosoma brucei gambiense (strain MHOM/CI/86/DAL972) TaxID=679716 RepID=D0A9Z9_TRYB9|nr:hypothetical protein, conserved [Trypanosoma brucei gambiense DAL972]CBH18500.1 hypothetical protein, conserved [Trypanosoma brucei gambiense DAL972]|eukprot:XP_011780764.1 hypothetical protein, conserved [Trypanosoma brucei gambiense DAL972]
MTILRRVTSAGRRREQASKAVQTEMTYPPDCSNLDNYVEACAASQFQDLCRLRSMIEDALKEVACSVYDVNSFKDVIFKLDDQLSSKLPLTDLLLLTSKLFRRTANLGRFLACFFAVIFAEGHADERFHFTELRLLRRELLELKGKYAKVEEERVRLQHMLDEAGEVAINHNRTVELLEARNAVLKLHSLGLEDQMALLFSQMNKDMQRYCKDAYDKVYSEFDQDQANMSKEVFRQSMDTLSDQLRHSRTLITEVRDLVMNCAQSPTGGSRAADQKIAKEPSIRFKLKQVEGNFQHIVARFSAVKDFVSETTHNLMSAMQERKNILFLALQHIRLYDIQNSKMRKCKASLSEMKRLVNNLQKRMPLTFPPGTVAIVDRIGHISTQKWHVGCTLEAIRGQRSGEPVDDRVMAGSPTRDDASDQGRQCSKTLGASEPQVQRSTAQHHLTGLHGLDEHSDEHPTTETRSMPSYVSSNHTTAFQSVYSMIDMISTLGTQIDELNDNLMFENEVNTFLKILTLSIPTTPRGTDELSNAIDEEVRLGLALFPTGDIGGKHPQSVMGASVVPNASDRDGAPVLAGTTSDSKTEALPHQERVKDGSVTSSETEKQVVKEAQEGTMAEFASKLGFLRHTYETRIADLERREADFHRFLAGGAFKLKEKHDESKDAGRKGSPQNRNVRGRQRSKAGSVSEERKQQEDMNQLVQARSEWQQSKVDLQNNKRLRETVMKEITKMSNVSSDTGEVTDYIDRSERSNSSAM